MSKSHLIELESESGRCILNTKFFEFASLKDGILSICMGHAMGSKEDFTFEDPDGELIIQLLAKLEGHEGISCLLDRDDNVRAVLNINNVAYIHWHQDDLEGNSEPMDVADVWYQNYGFRLANEDANSIYQNIKETVGLNQ